MTRAILFTIAALTVTPAAAQTYGTADGGCERAAGNPINDTDAYFDGTYYGGQDWGCDLKPAGGDQYLGKCAAEGSEDTVSFTVAKRGDEVTITAADGTALTLQRCE